MPHFELETSLGATTGQVVAGIDEVGRGPLAGPVVAGAVCFPGGAVPSDLAERLDDSKRLTPSLRELLAREIHAQARTAIGIASVAEIDRLNILEASLLAMTRAAEGLGVALDAILVDGRHIPKLPCPATAVVGGDGISLSIAAASIVAKVHRDELMRAASMDHPGYGWETNAGYGTAAHLEALRSLGVTEMHRRSFRPVREALALNY